MPSTNRDPLDPSATSLSYLSSPVPDLASTLMASPEILDANDTFLHRAHEHDYLDSHAVLTDPILSTLDQQSSLSQAALLPPDTQVLPVGSVSTTSRNVQTTYPSSFDYVRDVELRQILHDLRSGDSNTHDDNTDNMARATYNARARLRALRQDLNRTNTRPTYAEATRSRMPSDESEAMHMTSTTAEQRHRDARTRIDALLRRSDSLIERNATARFMQSIHPSTTASTASMLRYVNEHLPSNNAIDDPALPIQPRVPRSDNPRQSIDTYNLERPAPLDDSDIYTDRPPWARRATPSTRAPRTDFQTRALHHASAPFLDNAITYLDRLRNCHDYEQALFAAIETGFGTKEFFADKHDDFTMSVRDPCSPAPSSWLKAGVGYHGSQSMTGVRYPRAPSLSNLNRSEQNATQTFVRRQQWPVKVNLEHVDLSDLTLTGTMMAYNVITTNCTTKCVADTN